jgi:hypothetical protein
MKYLIYLQISRDWAQIGRKLGDKVWREGDCGRASHFGKAGEIPRAFDNGRIGKRKDVIQ